MTQEPLDLIKSRPALDEPRGKCVPEAVEPETVILEASLSDVSLEQVGHPSAINGSVVQHENML